MKTATGVWRTLEVWKFVGGDQSPVGEINLTHKLPRGGFTPSPWARGVNLSTRGGRERERNERRPRCSPYQDLFASPPCEERVGREPRRGTEGGPRGCLSPRYSRRANPVSLGPGR
ncbi:Uncharacterized protein DBV15_10296 [Temnothorax longispinosus]|uniref:Uncharacterized protein n=1 Tax=Temnothorax longispinosus TaxID=300112 RepID=A0A4S2JAB4_9HYME|nr:Uncharacterized protein DBV15_10296 [Temnothorax longispinosus]